MNKTIAALVTGLALFSGVPAASAAVTVIATDSPDSISVGGVVTLNLTIDLTPSAKKYFDPDITGGFITLFSGDGQEHTFKIDPAETTESFSWQFTYDKPGNFIPKYFGLVTYSEKFKDFEGFGYRKGEEFDIDKIFKFQFVKGKFDDPGVDGPEVNVAAAPELSTWAMMLIGFSFVGFAAYRRQRRAVAAIG